MIEEISMRKIKRGMYVITAIVLSYMIYNVSIILLKVGMKDVSKNIFFFTLGMYLILPLLKRIKINVEEDEKLKRPIYVVNKSLKEIKGNEVTKLQGLTLKGKVKKEYIDSIIITKRGLFNIVMCDYSGDISIMEDGSWVKKTRRETQYLKSPLEKIKRNRSVLSEVLDEEIISFIISS